MEHYKNLDLKDITYFCEIDLAEKTEQWKDIPKYEGFYIASDLGRIKTLNYNKTKIVRILKQQINNNYLKLTFFGNLPKETMSVHRLVAQAFIPNPDNKPEVNHIGLYPDGRQGNKLDNRVVSLEWATKSENGKHSYHHGLSKIIRGESHKSKLTEKAVLEIRDSDLKYDILARMYDVSKATIYDIMKRRSWKHL